MAVESTYCWTICIQECALAKPPFKRMLLFPKSHTKSKQWQCYLKFTEPIDQILNIHHTANQSNKPTHNSLLQHLQHPILKDFNSKTIKISDRRNQEPHLLNYTSELASQKLKTKRLIIASFSAITKQMSSLPIELHHNWNKSRTLISSVFS